MADQKVTKQEILDFFKKEGITDLDSLADYATKATGHGGGAGKVSASVFITPHYVGSH